MLAARGPPGGRELGTEAAARADNGDGADWPWEFEGEEGRAGPSWWWGAVDACGVANGVRTPPGLERRFGPAEEEDGVEEARPASEGVVGMTRGGGGEVEGGAEGRRGWPPGPCCCCWRGEATAAMRWRSKKG